MIEISIIVAIYNVEPFIRSCVESLLTADVHDAEIIVIDDGSTDDSGKICDTLVAIGSKDKN
ncbi:MAG: glycosyltransferase, partial [Fusobacteriaceae bacterium]|nr:glycosyltransferase [Fusobacteriaceae bacterium]